MVCAFMTQLGLQGFRKLQLQLTLWALERARVTVKLPRVPTYTATPTGKLLETTEEKHFWRQAREHASDK